MLAIQIHTDSSRCNTCAINSTTTGSKVKTILNISILIKQAVTINDNISTKITIGTEKI